MGTSDVTTPSNGSYIATYHDTADRRLTRANIALRRRMTNGVGLWEADIAGHVVSAPGGPAGVPEEIARVLTAPLRGAEIVEVARMRTADDVAVLEGQHVLRTFRDEHEALRDTLVAPREPAKRAAAIEHVRAYLADQLREIERTDPVLRTSDDVEAVHDLRVAARRSRAVLRAARDAFDPDWLDRLRDELQWLGSELGAARDLDVLLDDLRPEAERMGAEATPILKRLERQRGSTRRRVVAALESDRYLALLDSLRAAVDHPPVREFDLRLERIAAREFRKLRRDVGSLGAAPTDSQLHRVRIRAKRARYASELATPVAGRRAKQVVNAAKRFQDVLGTHQDAVVAEQRIRAVAENADTAFGAGRLVERQRLRREQAQAAFPKAWKRLERRGRRAWA